MIEITPEHAREALKALESRVLGLDAWADRELDTGQEGAARMLRDQAALAEKAMEAITEAMESEEE
ncbi:MAG: hypothetical protein CL537_07800 [Alcanivoracaceae bacterium]|nr:hypothetical protein [Alcanivoracaceae bacterium]|tara:strand:- start:220 stop:417 length:198 start_codon:yes stop_codon:yes gene_type:complete